MSQDGDFDGIVAGHIQDEDLDPDGIFGGVVEPANEGSPRCGKRKRGQGRVSPYDGTCIVWLVGDLAAGSGSENPAVCAPPDAPSKSVVALALVSWLFAEPSDSAQADHEAVTQADRLGGTVLGYVRYSLLSVWRLSQLFALPQSENGYYGTVEAVSWIIEFGSYQVDGPTGGQTVASVLAPFAHLQTGIHMMSWTRLYDVLLQDLPALFHSMAIRGKTVLKDMIADFPPAFLIKRWRADRGVAFKRARVDSASRKAPQKRSKDDILYQKRSKDDILYELPKNLRPWRPRAPRPRVHRRPSVDPLVLIRAAGFARYLRDMRDFRPALQAADAFERPATEDELRDTSSDPCRSLLATTFQRLDIVDCLIHRRRFAADFEHDTLVSINVYSDSSPNAGEEIQGMVADILREDEEPVRVILPAGTLAYGLFDGISKAICLLHSFWMLAGPTYLLLSYVLSKVVSVTTDYGTELSTLTMDDCVLAYCLWMGGLPLGQCKQYVNKGARWLPNALRVGGWCHSWGNIMRLVAESCPEWTRYLAMVRDVVPFFRNPSWRFFLSRKLKALDIPGLDLTPLLKGPCQIAKWRYETIAAAFVDLLTYRDVCRHFLLEWFSTSKETELIRKAWTAVQDDQWWAFLSTTSREMFTPCELARHWGMVCKCLGHQMVRHEMGNKSIRIKCWWNSRRLSQAEEFIFNFVADRRTRYTSLTQAECEGNQIVFGQTKALLLKVCSLARGFFKYLSAPPWSFHLCSTPEGARICLEHVGEIAMDLHDPFTRDTMETFSADIEARAGGAELTLALSLALRRFDTIALDESAGEGYHRATTREKSRAVGSKALHLKQATRRKDVMRNIGSFRANGRSRADAVLRFEFEHWPRILQTQRKRRWAAPRLRKGVVLKRVYREDAKSLEDWRSVVSRENDPFKPEREQLGNVDACKREYLLAITKVGEQYSVPIRVEPSAADGAEIAGEATERPLFFF